MIRFSKFFSGRCPVPVAEPLPVQRDQLEDEGDAICIETVVRIGEIHEPEITSSDIYPSPHCASIVRDGSTSSPLQPRASMIREMDC